MTSREVTMNAKEPDSPGLQPSYREKRMSPLCFYGFPVEKFRAIATIPWFTRTSVDEDVKNDFVLRSVIAIWMGLSVLQRR